MAKKETVAEGIYRKNGRLIVSWWDPQAIKRDGRKGRRLQKTMDPGTTLREAKAFKRKMESEKDRRPAMRQAETVDSFAARWMDDFGHTATRTQETTRKFNTERVKKLAVDFAGRELGSITREEAYQWARENPRRRSAVTAMFNDAESVGLVDSNPFSNLRLPKSKGRSGDRLKVITPAELERLFQICVNKYGDYANVFGNMVRMAAWTGMRPGELYALEWRDIDLERKEIHVVRSWQSKTGQMRDETKTGGHRRIALLPQIEAILPNIPRHPSEPFIFYTKQHRRFTVRIHHYYWDPVRTAFHDQLDKDRKRDLKPDMDFYELRHFFGSYLANTLHLSPYDIAKQMGHQDGGKLAMKTYIHTETDESIARVLAAAESNGGAVERKVRALKR